MYRYLIKPILFALNIEQAHHLAVILLRIIGFIPGGRWILSKCYSVHHPSLEREVFGVHFQNPIGLAAGFDHNGDVVNELGSLGFGFVEMGIVTPQPQNGNPCPRLFRLPNDEAIINRLGFANRGLKRALQNLRRPHSKTIVGCNIGKNISTPAEDAPKDYLKVYRNLYQYADYFAVNLCCDNACTETISHRPDYIMRILEPLFDFRRGQNQYRPILLKISPDLNNEEVDHIIDILLSTPLDGIVATTGSYRRDGLQTTDETLDKIGAGRLSGKPLTRRSIEIVRRIHERSGGNYPIIGVGGMMTVDDVREMLKAGADLVQIYSGLIYHGPHFIREVCTGLVEDAQRAAILQAERERKELIRRTTEEAAREARAIDLAQDIADKAAEVAEKTKYIREAARKRRK